MRRWILGTGVMAVIGFGHVGVTAGEGFPLEPEPASQPATEKPAVEVGGSGGRMPASAPAITDADTLAAEVGASPVVLLAKLQSRTPP